VNVISDRYNYSTIAYGSLDCDKKWLEAVNSRFELPDLVIFLDVPPDICIERIEKERGSLELYETVEKLTEVRNNYLNLFNKLIQENKTEYTIINGNKTIQEVANIINILIKNNINKCQTYRRNIHWNIAKSLVDNKDAVKIDRKVDKLEILLLLNVAPEDLPKIIGKEDKL